MSGVTYGRAHPREQSGQPKPRATARRLTAMELPSLRLHARSTVKALTMHSSLSLSHRLHVVCKVRDYINDKLAGMGPRMVGLLANSDPAARKYAQWTSRACNRDGIRYEVRVTAAPTHRDRGDFMADVAGERRLLCADSAASMAHGESPASRSLRGVVSNVPRAV